MTNQITIPESSIGLLYEDGAFARELTPGKHRFGSFWESLAGSVTRRVTVVDLRERSVTIKGQEILTADKAAIRISLLVYFKVMDAKAALHHVTSYEERIYEDVQLAARRFLASRALTDILNDRNDISDAVKKDVASSAGSYGVEIVRADVKDLVFPGNLREIMNQVLEVERRSEAKLVEARREAEVSRIKAEAAAATQREQLEMQRAAQRVALEAEADKQRLRLLWEIDEAKALRDHPELLELRKVSAFSDMAKAGAKFVVGLPSGSLTKIASE